MMTPEYEIILVQTQECYNVENFIKHVYFDDDDRPPERNHAYLL
jgi:hypothetical protein